MKLTAIRSLCLFGVLSASSQAYAASTSFSTTVPQFGGIATTTQPITGLSQFDPSQGTLTGITISGRGDFTALGSLFALVVDETLPHEIDVSASYQISVGINLPGGGGLLVANGGGSFDFFCDGSAFDSSCINQQESFEDSGVYDQSEEILQRVTDAGILNEFIGTGDISGGLLELGLFTFPDSGGIDIFTLENLFIDEFEVAFDLGFTDVTIQYDYDPVTLIPVPAAVWLFGSALVGFAGLARRKKV